MGAKKTVLKVVLQNNELRPSADIRRFQSKTAAHILAIVPALHAQAEYGDLPRIAHQLRMLMLEAEEIRAKTTTEN